MTSRTLTESSKTLVSSNGTYKAVLITPGRGSSGFYSEEMLRAYGPEAFPKGSHSYLDHTESRSPEKLMAVLEEDAYFEDGVGLVASIKPMPHWKDFIEAVAPHVGLSISAEGTGSMQTLEENQEPIFVVESLVPNIMNTVDFVSYAGRGGKVVESLLESALANGTHSESSAGTGKEGNEMATLEEAVAQITALNTEVAKVVSAQEAAAAAELSEAEIDAKIAEAVKAAVAATRAVAKAEVSEKLADKLYAQIESGDYDVEDKLAEYAEIASEVKEKLTENLHPAFVGSFASSSGSAEPKNYAVGQWGKR